MKRLYIVRHGAAQSAYEAGSDFARRLTPAGVEGVKRAADWLRSQEDMVPPQRILASLAPRALETAAIFADGFGLSGDAFSKVRELYSGGANDYLNVLVRALLEGVACAMAVGHNPAVSELLAVLTGATAGDYRMGKGDVACVTFDVPDEASWEEIYTTAGRLERYTIASSL